MTLDKLNSIVDKAAETHGEMVAASAGAFRIAPIGLHNVPLQLFLTLARRKYAKVSVLGPSADGTALYMELPGIHLFSQTLPQEFNVDA